MRKCYIALRVNIDFTNFHIRIDAKAGSSENPHARMYQYSKNWNSKCNLGSQDLIFIDKDYVFWWEKREQVYINVLRALQKKINEKSNFNFHLDNGSANDGRSNPDISNNSVDQDLFLAVENCITKQVREKINSHKKSFKDFDLSQPKRKLSRIVVDKVRNYLTEKMLTSVNH